MFRYYKFRINPTKEQEVLLNKHFGACRWVYNYALDLKIQECRGNKIESSIFDISKTITQFKKQEEFKWLKEINAQSLQASLNNLDSAYINYFKHNKNFPKFKSKSTKQSYQCPQYTRIEGDKLIIRKFREGIKINLHRKFEGIIKTTTISKTPTGKYFAFILIETSQIIPPLKPINPETTIGIDTGIKTFLTLSNGETFENNRYLKNSLQRLKVLHKRHSKKQKGSKNKEKARLKLTKLYEKITNQREDYIHKVTTKLTKENQFSTICIEDLNVAGMGKLHSLAQCMGDVSLGKFYKILSYKCEWQGINLIKIGRFEASSKTCNECQTINQDLTLKDREWVCKSCGIVHDRDFNASKNIRNWGLNPKSGVACSFESVESLTLVGTVKQKNNENIKI